jgi:flagellar hook assembly protein FlgD
VILDGYVFRSDLGEVYDTICTGGLKQRVVAADEFSVVQGSANPAGSGIFFSVGLHGQAHVNFTVYDVTGKRARTLADEALPAGVTVFQWDGTNERSEAVPSGIYFYRAIAAESEVISKLILLK